MCTRSCGSGAQKRSRHVKRPAKLGGAPCPLLHETRTCNSNFCPVDCVVSDWLGWSACPQTCNPGGTDPESSRTRTRTTTTAPQFGGTACPVTHMAMQCGTSECPVDCEVSPYGQWGACSTRYCGGGIKLRTRAVTHHPSYGGAPCTELHEQQACNTVPCAIGCTSRFGEWSECSRSCGNGVQTRVLTLGGPDGGCPANEQRLCNTAACPVDCIVSGFGQWSGCIREAVVQGAHCGGGYKVRSRNPIADQHITGLPCPALTEAVSCEPLPCPEPCQLSQWTLFGSCSRTCGTGVKTRARRVEREPKNGGANCPTLEDVVQCNGHLCPQDCQVTSWSVWGSCSQTCGEASRTRLRHVSKPSESGGKGCPSLREQAPCSSQMCPVDCIVASWSDWSECSQECGGGVAARSRGISVRDAFEGTPCPKLAEIQACNVEDCPTHCEFGFSDWGL